MSAAFLITSLVIVATPGTGALYTIAAGLVRGGRAGALAAFACTLGILPHLIAAMTGLAAVLHTSGVAFNAIKYAGVAYLLYLAWATWRDTGMLSLENAPERAPARSVIATGVTINLLNPKLTIFFFAFLPQFVPAGSDRAFAHMLALSAVFMAMTFVVFVAYGYTASAMRDRVLQSPRVMRRLRQTFAASFVALGARLAVESR